MRSNGVGGQRIGIDNTARHIDFDRRGRFLQATSLQHEVLKGFVVSIFISTRIAHFAIDGQRLVCFCFLDTGDEQYILILQRDIGNGAVHDALHVNRNNLQRASGFHAMHDGTVGECKLRQTVGCFNQGAHTIDVVAHLIHTRTEHSTLDLHHVLKTRDDGVNAYRVVICHMEGTHVELVDVIHGIQTSVLSDNTYRLRVSITGKTSGVADQRANTLALLHFVVHRTLHLTCDVHQAVVRTDSNDVVVSQLDIARQLAIEDIVIDIDCRYQMVVTIDLHITQRTQVVRTACHI